MGAAASAIEEKKEIGEGPGFEEEAKVKANVYLNKGPIILDSFELLKVIGKGQFGKVLLVQKKGTTDFFAMKVLKKEVIISQKQVQQRLNERMILERANSPFVPKLRYAFQTDTELYLVTDFYKGNQLFVHLRRKIRFTEDQAKS
jgi:serine/threonine protein kinase